MKKILFIILLFCSLNAFAQCRIGFSHQEIKKELTTRKLDFIDKGTIIVNYNHNLTTYIFTDDLCIATIIAPLDKIAYDSLIERYNTYYTKVDTNKWVIPNNGIVIILANNVFTLKYGK